MLSSEKEEDCVKSILGILCCMIEGFHENVFLLFNRFAVSFTNAYNTIEFTYYINSVNMFCT